jgi:hypothetical protein
MTVKTTLFRVINVVFRGHTPARGNPTWEIDGIDEDGKRMVLRTKAGVGASFAYPLHSCVGDVLRVKYTAPRRGLMVAEHWERGDFEEVCAKSQQTHMQKEGL